MSQWSRVWPGHANVFRNNTVILRGARTEYAVFDKSLCFGNGSTSSDQAPSLGWNTVFTASGNVTVCGVPLADYQARADLCWNDSGSASLPVPADGSAAASIFLEKARQVLAMPLGLGSHEESSGPPRPGQWPANGSQQPTKLEAHGLDGNGDADVGWNSERVQLHTIVA